MIRHFSFSNFCSFSNESFVDFTTSEKTPTDRSFFSTKHGDQVSLLTGVFGPNASGKTNLLKALSFISFFARDSYGHLKPDDQIPVDLFSGSDEKGSPASFEVEFDGAGGRYLYAFRLTRDEVCSEVLKQYSPKTGQFRTVLSRTKTNSGGFQLRSPTNFTEVSLLREVLIDRPNASMLAAGLQTGRKEFEAVLQSLNQVATNVTRSGKIEQPFENLTSDLFTCSEFFQKHPEHHDALRELLGAADMGISDFSIEPVHLQHENGESRQSHLIFFQHEGPFGEFSLSADRESSGTKRLLMLFETFLRILSVGGIAVIDEMESDLHPHLIPTIFDLFTSPEINTKQAQLFFTCHHVEMLNHLQKEQIILVEKNDQCVSEAFRLDEIKGVRREENHFANYNAGRYGAIPQPEVVAF